MQDQINQRHQSLVIGCHWYDRHVTCHAFNSTRHDNTSERCNESQVQLGQCEVGREVEKEVIGEVDRKVFETSFKKKSVPLLVYECVCFQQGPRVLICFGWFATQQ
jgi:hypothetical protein